MNFSFIFIFSSLIVVSIVQVSSTACIAMANTYESLVLHKWEDASYGRRYTGVGDLGTRY